MVGTDEPEGFGDNAEDMGSETEEEYGSEAGERSAEDDAGESGSGEDTGESGSGDDSRDDSGQADSGDGDSGGGDSGGGAEEGEGHRDRDEDVAEPFDDEERDGGLRGGMDAGQDDDSSGM